MRDFNLKNFSLDWMGRSGQFRSPMRGTFWPSEASVRTTNANGETEVVGKCIRAVYYRLSGVRATNPPTAKSQVIFLLGKQIEEAMVEVWKQAGIWDNNGVRFEDRTRNISGEYDCIIRNPVSNGKLGVELKSFWGYFQEKHIMGYSEGRGANKHWVWGKPKDENLLQAAIYCDQTRDVLEGFKLFYVSRDNCEMAEFNITVDDNGDIFIHDPKRDANIKETRFNIHNVYERYAELANAVSNNQIPPKDYNYRPNDDEVQRLYDLGKISDTAYKNHTSGKERYSDFHCGYCEYKDHCQGAE